MKQMPIRVQRSRRKGSTLPPNTVVVTRGTRFGNPFAVGRHYKRGGMGIPKWGMTFVFTEAYDGFQDDSYTTIKDRAQAVEWYRWYLTKFPSLITEIKTQLAGKNVACWCPLNKPCHADVLLEIAYAPEPSA